MTSPSINPIPLLRSRLDLLTTLRKLSREQLELIQQEKIEEVNEVIEVKQAVILRLDSWQRTNGPLLENWNRIEASLDSAVRESCRDLRQATDRELAEFQKSESESQTRVRQQRDQVSQELFSVARGAQTLSAYENSTSAPSRSAFDINQ